MHSHPNATPQMTEEAESGIQFHPIYVESGWRCDLFGGNGEGLVWRPRKGNVPNFFWRWMQRICFGNRWVKEK